MVIEALINGEHLYKLCSWSAQQFAGDPTLHLQTDDLKEVKQVFAKIDKIEILVGGTPAGMYNQYDMYESISYGGRMWVEHENIFADCMNVTLNRSSLADEVARLAELVNPTVDIDAMTVDEYREYIKKLIGKTCRDEIYAGTQVQLSDGTVEYFTYKAEDQQNLANAISMLDIVFETDVYPYHPSGGITRLMKGEDLVTIYTTLQLRLMDLTTRGNLINMWLKTIDTKEELAEIHFDTPLPKYYQDLMDEFHVSALKLMNEVMQYENEFDLDDEEEEEE